MKSIILTGLATSLFALSLVAQTPAIPDKPNLPAGPLLSKPAAYSKWEINYVYASDKGPKSKETPEAAASALIPEESVPGKIKKVTLLHTEPLWHVEAEDSKGITTGLWYDGMTMFTEVEGVPVAVSRMTGVTIPLDFGATGYPDLDWITADKFVGMDSSPGLLCMVFKRGDTTAWVALDGRYPVLWQRKDETRTFKQLARPSSALTLPARMAKESEAIKHDAKLLVRPKARFEQ